MTNGPSDPPGVTSRAEEQLARRERAQRLVARRRRARQRGFSLLVAVVATITAVCFWVFGGDGSPAAPLEPLHTGSGGTTPVSSTQLQLPMLASSVARVGEDEGTPPKIPFPSKGQGAVAMLGSGIVAESAGQHPVPIASLTKMMTAYLVLQAHPLHGAQNGPTEHFTAADHAAWIRYSEQDLSNVELVAGEALTERQMLEALLLPSADNMADWLARWVGGTEANFVDRMNTTARSLGMTHTHYADASGVDPKTVSTASDQALLASILMRNRVVRSIVSMPDVAFPVEGSIWNVNPALGVDGIVGVKSGFTQEASGCLVTAAWRKVGGRPVLVIAAATGAPYGLWQAADEDEAMLSAASSHLQLVSPFGWSNSAGTISIPWSHEHADAHLSGPVRLVGWGGIHYSAKVIGARVTKDNLAKGWSTGCIVAELRIRSQYGPVTTVPIMAGRSIGPPPSGTVRSSGQLVLAVR